MRVILAFSFILFLNLTVSGQSFWKSINQEDLPEHLEQSITPDHFSTFQLDFNQFQESLVNTPWEDLTNSAAAGKVIYLPMPNGELAQFKIWETSIFQPITAARYPQLRSYRGVGLDNTGAAVRIAISPKGVHLGIHSPDGDIYVDPYANGNTELYISYYTKDDMTGGQPAACGFTSFEEEFTPENLNNQLNDNSQVSTNTAGGPVEMREFLVALSCSGEFAQGHGGTVESVLADYQIAMNRLNLIYEQNLATRFSLIDGLEAVLYLDPDTDPFSNGTVGTSMLIENATNLNLIMGEDNFDVGHVFTGGCSDVGGVASGQICGEFKGAGVTCHGNPNVTVVTANIMAHEIGHQLSAGHTWNGCNPSIGQYASGSAWEPGSGTTIMSYAGACGNENNVDGGGDEYFHGGTIDQMSNYIRNGSATCGGNVITDNNFPDVTALVEDDFFIPISTPFELEVVAEDMDGDQLTYCWEQRDLGPYGNLGFPELNAPLFRSYPPNSSPKRIFPTMQTIVQGGMDRREILPTYSRDLNFSCTVRDNNPLIGGVTQAYVSFRSTEQAGPFLVSYPNGSDNLEVGSFQEILWDVANTDQSPVNCKRVDLLLSLDGGFTYPITLAEDVVNDGDYGIIIPDEVSSTARIMVRAADNIFFDISNTDFSIVPPSAPGYSLLPSEEEIVICPPATQSITLTTESLVNFAEPISFSVSDLPAGATADFSATTIMPGETTTLNLDLTNLAGFGSGEFKITATANGLEAKERIIEYIAIDNDFSALVLNGPINGSTGIGGAPTYSWVDIPNADSYEIQIAKNPNFVNAGIVESVDGIIGAVYDAGVQLEKGRPYYWRVRPVNLCGPGPYSTTYAFFTEVQSCGEFSATDIPISIPDGTASNTSVTSVINVADGANINDFNITSLVGDYDFIKHIDVRLSSPAGTSVLLFEDLPCTGIPFDLKLDDDSAELLPCPPNTGEAYKVQDAEGLAKFNGENSAGDWTLTIEVINNFGEGGTLDAWSFEICGNLSPNNPVLVNNEMLEVPVASSNPIQFTSLLSEDIDNGPEELRYTIVEAPTKGRLFRNNTPLLAGSAFTQQQIYNSSIFYQHDGTEEETDAFTFTVSDGTGGWLGTPVYNINITDNAVVGTSEAEADQTIGLYPNPASDLVNITFKAPLENVQLRIYNIQGQKIQEQILETIGVNHRETLNTARIPNGIYFLEVQSDTGRVVKKMTIQR